MLVLGVVLGGASLARGERIYVVADSDVPLYDPSSVAGPWRATLKTVGTLVAGAKAPVVECIDRKSNIDIRVQHRGTIAVIGGDLAQVKLHRSDAYLWQKGVTNSCRGVFAPIQRR
jgi:hypothetical protein